MTTSRLSNSVFYWWYCMSPLVVALDLNMLGRTIPPREGAVPPTMNFTKAEAGSTTDTILIAITDTEEAAMAAAVVIVTLTALRHPRGLAAIPGATRRPPGVVAVSLEDITRTFSWYYACLILASDFLALAPFRFSFSSTCSRAAGTTGGMTLAVGTAGGKTDTTTRELSIGFHREECGDDSVRPAK